MTITKLQCLQLTSHLSSHADQPSALVLPLTISMSFFGRSTQSHRQAAGRRVWRQRASQARVLFKLFCVPIVEQPAISISKQLYVKVEDNIYRTEISVQSTSLPGVRVARLQVWLHGGLEHPRGSQPLRCSLGHPRHAEGGQDWPSLNVSSVLVTLLSLFFGIQNQNKFSIIAKLLLSKVLTLDLIDYPHY